MVKALVFKAFSTWVRILSWASFLLLVPFCRIGAEMSNRTLDIQFKIFLQQNNTIRAIFKDL